MLIALYLVAIVSANLIIAFFGPQASVVTAFVFIGFDLTARDGLHEQWRGKNLWWKMLLLIASGSLLSYALNVNAGPIALASFVAFAGAGMADTLVYWLLGSRGRLFRINGSNVVSSAVDSFLFPLLAFGLPLLWPIVIGQFAAKVVGGYAWSIVLSWMTRRRLWVCR